VARAPSVAWVVARVAPATGRAPLTELATARRHFVNLCQFLRLAGATANQCILEAMKSEKIAHVVDLGGANATQWLDLLHLLACTSASPACTSSGTCSRRRPWR
jgi:hypothetical protein